MASSLPWASEDMSASDTASFSDGPSSSEDPDTDPAFESMTAKGIKRLCSELLELKKASDEDFHRNVSANISVFFRIFKEVGGVATELTVLKQHVSTQKKLVEDLACNLYSDIVLSDELRDIGDEESDDLGDLEDGRDSILETVDILLAEHQDEEALLVLQAEIDALQNMQTEGEPLLPDVVSYMSDISDRRDTLADRFASLAEHPRVSQGELQYALSGLSRLGESNRADLLLVAFYRSRLERSTRELQMAVPFSHGAYIIELAKAVFSVISQAARCFFMLYGDASPYASELIQWTGEEVEAFSHTFDTYVRSMSEISGGLPLVVEAANSALSYCALLKPQNMVLQPYLTKLIRPSMEAVLQMHMDRFKKVIGFFATTDTWVLSKFPISGILRDKSSFTGISGEVEYCPLTSSGRKFVSLVQAIVDDITPLVNLQMENSILKGLADLFNEYMRTLEKAIPDRGHIVENDPQRMDSAQTLQQQISLLVNSSTLVYFFPSIAGTIFKGMKFSNDQLFPEHPSLSSQDELDTQMLSILEAADRLRDCFCQRFVYEVMSQGECYVTTNLDSYVRAQCTLSSSEMPSLAFQALFLCLRQLELSKSTFAGEDGIVKMLLEELMETVIVWLSNNQDFWERTNDCSFMPKFSCLEQVHLDMHFLLEIAKRGGYFSDDLMVAASDLIEQIGDKFADTKSYANSEEHNDEWASKAAKLAMEKLLEIEVAESEQKEEIVASLGEDGGTLKLDGASPFEGDDTTYNVEDFTDLVNGESEESVEDVTILTRPNMEMNSLEVNSIIDDSDEEGLSNPPTHMEDEHGSNRTDTETGTNSDYSLEPDIEGLAVIPKLVSVRNLVSGATGVTVLVIDKSQYIGETETMASEAEFCEISQKLDATDALDVTTLAVEANSPAISDKQDFLLENKPVMLVNGDISGSIDNRDGSVIYAELVPDDSHRIAEERTTNETSSVKEEQGYELLVDESCERNSGSGANHAKDGRNSSINIENKLTMLQITDTAETSNSIDKNSSSTPTTLPELAQDDSPRPSEEWTTDDSLSVEEEPQARRSNRIVTESSSEKQARVRATRVGGSRRNTSRSVVLWSRGHRSKPEGVAENSGKNRKGLRVTRPMWH